MQELLEIAKAVFPGADKAEILPPPARAICLSWKTHDDPERPSKRFQPVIIELRKDFLPEPKLPDRVSAELRQEFTDFVQGVRTQFKPRTTPSRKHMHTPDHWFFPPQA